MKNHDKCCIFVHGFANGHHDMNYIADIVAKDGFKVILPTLPGHESNWYDFEHSTFDDWLSCVVQTVSDAKQKYKIVFLCGFSLGGDLGLLACSKLNVDGLITIDAPLRLSFFYPWFVPNWRLLLLPVFKIFINRLHRPPRSLKERQYASSFGYEEYIHLKPLSELLKGLKKVRVNIHKVKTPICVIQCDTDMICSVKNAYEIINNVASIYKVMYILQRKERFTNGHMVVTHIEMRQQVAHLILNFTKYLLKDSVS